MEMNENNLFFGYIVLFFNEKSSTDPGNYFFYVILDFSKEIHPKFWLSRLFK